MINYVEELALCFHNFPYFLGQYCYLKNMDATSDSPREPFGITGNYEYTYVLAYTLQHAQYEYFNRKTKKTDYRPANIIMYKSRQMGCSWLVDAFCLWFAAMFPMKDILVFSMTEPYAKQHIERIQFMIEQMDPEARENLIGPVTLLKESIEFKRSGSRIQSYASTGRAGRGTNAALVVLDEFAHMDKAEELYTAIAPATQQGGRLLIISTPKLGSEHEAVATGAQEGTTAPPRPEFWHPEMRDEHGRPIPFVKDRWFDWFKQTIQWDPVTLTANIEENQWPVGRNKFLRIALHFSADPSKDESWAEEQFHRLNGNIQRWAAEYYLDPQNAENTVFLKEAIMACYESNYIIPETVPVIEGCQYILGCDFADGGDNTVITVLEAETGIQVYTYAERIKISQGTDKLMQIIDGIIAQRGRPFIVIERNTFGTGVVNTIMRERRELIPYFYRYEGELNKDVRNKNRWKKIGNTIDDYVSKVGFPTNAETKIAIMTNLSEYMNASLHRPEDRPLTITDGMTVEELSNFMYHETPGGNLKMGAPKGEGFHDDRVLALAFAVYGMGPLRLKALKQETEAITNPVAFTAEDFDQDFKNNYRISSLFGGGTGTFDNF